MIRLARELLRMTLQMALLPLVWLFGAGAIATIVLAPIHFFKFGTGTGAEWDGFNVLVLADWKMEACSNGSGFTNWLSSAHNCQQSVSKQLLNSAGVFSHRPRCLFLLDISII